jgi:hypothetical protein
MPTFCRISFDRFVHTVGGAVIQGEQIANLSGDLDSHVVPLYSANYMDN